MLEQLFKCFKDYLHDKRIRKKIVYGWGEDK